MSDSAMLAFLLVAGVLTPGTALGQGAMEFAIAGPQPHFVAAWAPEKEREAERSAALAARVSLELRDVSLDAALKMLTNQAGLRITYSRAILPAGKRVTISAGDVAVVTALTEMLFRSGLDVVVDQDGALALVRCRHPGEQVRAEVQDSGAIAGTVTDRATGAAIAGATVVEEQTGRSVMTDNNGQFRIAELKPGTYILRVRYIGYMPSELVVTVGSAGDAKADVELERSVQELDELVTVTPGGIQTAALQLPNPVSVISAEEIADRRPQTFSDILRQSVPTAVAFHQPVTPVRTQVSIRGASSLSFNSNTTKIFIDGVEASSFGLSAVDPASIERVEVLRGPQASTVFGADAAGGVIQVFTKRGDPAVARPEVDLSVRGGLSQTPYSGFRSVFRQEYRGTVRGGSEDVSYGFGGGYSRLANWLPPGTTSDVVTSPSVYGGVRYTRGILAVDISGRYFHNSLPEELNPLIRTAGFVPEGRPSFRRGDYANETYGARLSLAPTQSWTHHLTLGSDRLTFESIQIEPRLTTPADTLNLILSIGNRKLSVQYATSVTVNRGAPLTTTFTGGVDHYRLDQSNWFTFGALNTTGGTIQTAPPGNFQVARAVITNTGLFLQADANWRETFFLTAGLRGDDNSAFGPDVGIQVLPRVGLSYVRQIGQSRLKLRGAYGGAIRTPDASLAFGSVSPSFVTLPNPSLAPERQRGWEAGFDLASNHKASLSFTLFDQNADNLIAAVPIEGTPVFTQQWQNVGRVRNTGIEVEASFQGGPVRLTAQYGHVRSRIKDLGAAAEGNFLQVGDEPRFIPRHTAGGSLTAAPWSTTRVTVGLMYVGSWREFDNLSLFRCFGGTGPCQPTFRGYIVSYPAFAKLNFAISQRLASRLDGSIAVENVTNNEAYEGSDAISVIGRTTMLGLRFRY